MMEYTVILTGQPGTPWRAAVPILPDCTVEAPTRSQALEKIRERIAVVTSHSEVLRLNVHAAPKTTGEELSATSQTPWQWFGAFQNDPTWGLLFDDIERQRDAHLLGE
jgi:predicted RNase H-like HicB family nuclease